MKKVFFVLALFTIFISTQAFGVTINFGDNSNYWPGWNNGTGDDSKDTIGIPGFTGGTAVINGGGRLTGLTFGQSITSSDIWGVLSPGDLFIDINADNNWDYFVDLTTWTTSGKTNPDPGTGNYPIYSISLALNSASGYILSGTDNTLGWSGYLIRNNHPVAYNNPPPLTSAYGSVGFSGWNNNTPASTYSFDFTGLSGGGLLLGDYFIIGWTVNCANDVIYETIDNPVPEPTTILLMGPGLLGLAGFARRKFRK